jgi:hypothetical protein
MFELAIALNQRLVGQTEKQETRKIYTQKLKVKYKANKTLDDKSVPTQCPRLHLPAISTAPTSNRLEEGG